MLQFIQRLFNSSDFMPHGHCYFWRPEVLWLHVISDGLIALAYFSIPLTLVYLARKRRDLPFPWLFSLFGLFIVACGATHVLSIVTVWTPIYRLDGIAKAITALASVGTALALIPMIPKILGLVGPDKLLVANKLLEEEIAWRKKTGARLDAQNEVAQIAAEKVSLHEAAPLFLKSICARLDWQVGELWTADPAAGVLRLAHGWHQPESSSVESALSAGFLAASRGWSFAHGQDLPGEVWSEGSPAWEHPVAGGGCVLREAAQTAGLGRAFAFPLGPCEQDPVCTVMVFLSREQAAPDPELTMAMNTLAAQIGQFTERRRAEAARNESQLRYRSLFENMLEGHAYCRLLYEHGRPVDYVYLEINDNFESLTGLKNVVGRKVSEVVPGMHESNPEQLEIYSRVAATGIPEKFESYAKLLGIWFSVSVYSYEKEHFVAVFDNITERKRAETALRESEERYRALIEWSHEAIAVQRNGILLFVNSAAVRMLGANTAQDLIGRLSLDFVHPDSHQHVLERRRTLDANGSGDIPLNEEKFVRLDGRVIDVETQGTVIVYDGEPAVYGSMRDVTEQKRAEAELRWKTAFLEAQVVSSLDGVLVVDGQGKKLLQNQRVTDLLEIPRYIADDSDDQIQLLWVTGMTKDPATFIVKVAHLFSHPDEISRDEIELTNGTILDCYSAPVVGDDGTYFGRIWTFRDVTDRKRTESRYRRLVESNVQGTVFWTVTGGITGANDAFLGLTGYSREDLEAGRINWIALTPPEYAYLDHRALEEIAAHGVSTPYEKEFIRKDGSRVPILLGSTAFADNPEEGVCFVLDRTELRASQTRFSAFMEDAPALVYMKDEEGRFLYGNRTLLRHFGLRSEEYLGKTDFDFWPEVTPALREVDAKVLASGNAVETNESVPLSDGSIGRWLSYKFPLRDESTGRKILAGMSVNITERERAEAALRQEREFLATILDKLQAGVVACDDQGRLTHCNRAAIALHGLHAGDPLPPLDRWSQYFDLVPENATEPLRDDAGPLASALRGEVLQDREFLVRPRNGPERILSLNATPFEDGDGHRLGAVAVIHDVTVMRQARQDALRALHEKEILLQEIHHRVKNNLQIIGSLLSMQARRSKSPDALEALRESANRVRSIALVHEKLYGSTDLESIEASDYLRTLSRNLTGTLGMELRPLNERRVLLDFELEDGHNLDPSTAIACGLVVNEALTNSFKHGFPDQRTGRVTVALRELTGEPVATVGRGPAGASGPAGGWLRLEIRDNGVGVPAAAFTAAGTLDLVSNSLGMRLIQDLSEQIGGRLEFVPTDAGTGAGLTLHLTFPVSVGRAAAREATLRAIPTASSMPQIP